MKKLYSLLLLITSLVGVSKQQNIFSKLFVTVQANTEIEAAAVAAAITESAKNESIKARDALQARVDADPTNMALMTALNVARVESLTAITADLKAQQLRVDLDEKYNGVNSTNHLALQQKEYADLAAARAQVERQIAEAKATYNSTTDPIVKETAKLTVQALSTLLVSGLESDLNRLTTKLNDNSGRSAKELADFKYRIDVTNQLIANDIPDETFGNTTK